MREDNRLAKNVDGRKRRMVGGGEIRENVWVDAMVNSCVLIVAVRRRSMFLGVGGQSRKELFMREQYIGCSASENEGKHDSWLYADQDG